MKGLKSFVWVLMVGLISVVEAAEILVTDNIVTSTTWTASNVYRLQKQIYVLPGASLTIEPGTVIASNTGAGGSLGVTRGARIYIHGTAENPVIFTSTSDVATWDPDPNHPTGRNPKTGTWREGVNEWGNLTIMGRGVLSGSHYQGAAVEITEDEDGIPGGAVNTRTNTKRPDGLNRRVMEGLVADYVGDPDVLYGGNDDNDNSGTIQYVSFRYGGKVIGLANELNGLSLGAVGRETDIHHVEIMNNVDDGIEIWGGTVNLRYVSIWNIGDDSIDVDQGWRGKIQFGLIVQGHSTDAARGSGVGDHCFETDGAEDSDAQPVTTSTIYNITAVGQPLSGRGGTAWRDNARIQYRNCTFMELGQQLVRLDNSDGDGGSGYGYNGTLSWAQTWTTPYTWSHSYANTINQMPAEPAINAFNHPTVLYTVQTSGNLAEIKDSVFYNNQAATAYTEADARGVRAPQNNNVTATKSPIRFLRRGPSVVRGGQTVLPVQFIDPRPANDAVTSASAAPDDGFFVPAYYRGGFAPGENWLEGWTAASAYRMTTSPCGPNGDTDADGVCDTHEGPNLGPPADKSNFMLADSDGDGLNDGQEDASRNGTKEADETSPRNRDTDGDRFLDGLDAAPLTVNAGFTDADQDELHDAVDPDPNDSDFDDDRFKDGYDAAVADARVGNGAGVPNLGDANGDNHITSLDALIMQTFFLQLINTNNPVFDQGTPTDSFVYMDVNRDGFVTSLDALVTQSYFMLLLATLPL